MRGYTSNFIKIYGQKHFCLSTGKEANSGKTISQIGDSLYCCRHNLSLWLKTLTIYHKLKPFVLIKKKRNNVPKHNHSFTDPVSVSIIYSIYNDPLEDLQIGEGVAGHYSS